MQSMDTFGLGIKQLNSITLVQTDPSDMNNSPKNKDWENYKMHPIHPQPYISKSFIEEQSPNRSPLEIMDMQKIEYNQEQDYNEFQDKLDEIINSFSIVLNFKCW